MASAMNQRTDAGTSGVCFEDLIDEGAVAWFDDFERRVKPYYGEHSDLAMKVLDTVVTRSHDWVSIDLLPDRKETLMIVDDLVRDHYLEQRGRSLRWRYPALQYIWARRRRLWDRP